ncbi:hypothetical protein GMRT_14183 [Giardia muris]|uniref:Uncharacterized protein n=1 Tax=Giardia muris TaxID=5742 RepID=A0A4Z1TCG3_GIAMU|nr:hypothetical protein GMRT_14183 [Giardia muris]|eukprot:TNJ30279.1 hypothetical protein GMRT_14183 [Giardia muris]
MSSLYDPEARAHENENRRVQREWLDRQLAEKAVLREYRRDGRVDEDEFDSFERRRVARFKYNLVKRIAENWSSVTEFDRAEAEQLARDDPEFRAALEAAHAARKAREEAKDRRLEQIREQQLASIKDAENKVGKRGRGRPEDLNLQNLRDGLLNDAQQSRAVSLPSLGRNTPEPAAIPSQAPRSLASGLGFQNLDSLPNQARTKTQSTPEYQSQPRVIRTQNAEPIKESPPVVVTSMAPSTAVPFTPQVDLTPLLLELREQRALLATRTEATHVSEMLSRFQKQVEIVIEKAQERLEHLVSDAVRQQIAEKIAEVNSLRELAVASRAAAQGVEYMRPSDPSISAYSIGCQAQSPEPSPVHASPWKRVQRPLAADSFGKYRDDASFTVDDSVDHMVNALRRRNRARMENLRKDIGEQELKHPEYSGLDRPIDDDLGPSGSQLNQYTQSLLSATDFLDRILSDARERGFDDRA